MVNFAHHVLECGTTDHKRAIDKTPLAWSANGETLDIYAESQQPFMADVVKKRREQNEMAAKADEGMAPEQKRAKAAPFSKLDFTARIILQMGTIAKCSRALWGRRRQ